MPSLTAWSTSMLSVAHAITSITSLIAPYSQSSICLLTYSSRMPAISSPLISRVLATVSGARFCSILVNTLRTVVLMSIVS